MHVHFMYMACLVVAGVDYLCANVMVQVTSLMGMGTQNGCVEVVE